MSVSRGTRWRTARRRVETARSVAVRVLFGDRLGLTLFLGTLCFAAIYWRIGVFINDNYTLANTLVSLADGRLAVDEAVYGPGLETPGMGQYDGAWYGRNYGQLAFALPFLWLLEGLALVVDAGIVFPAIWSLLVVAFGVEAGRTGGRPALGAGAGGVVGLSAFLANVALARPLPATALPLAAMQLSTIVATGLAATTLYRFLARVHGTRVGLVAGVALVTATPVGFWASIPKRHALVVLLVTVTCYAFHRSRQEPAPGASLSPLGFRALSYVPVGLLTWVNPGEAFAVFVALVAVDAATARSNDARSVGVVAGAFALSMVPFFVTNAAISGDPMRPPRMLDQFGSLTGGAGGTGGGSSAWLTVLADAVLLPLVPTAAAEPVSEAINRANILFRPFVTGVQTVVHEPDALYRTFVRGGYVSDIAAIDLGQAINLTFLEAAPVTAGCAAMVGAAASRLRARSGWRPLASGSGNVRARLGSLGTRIRLGSRDPLLATDALVALVAVLFTLIYLARLPLHAQVTVRYLLPLCPLLLYGMARQPSLRRSFSEHARTGVSTWLAGVLVGGQLLFLAVAAASLARGEAFQVHALVALAVAGVFAVLAVAGAFTDRLDRPTAAVAGLAAALGTDFLLLSGLVYFQYGQYALPAAGWLAELLASA